MESLERVFVALVLEGSRISNRRYTDIMILIEIGKKEKQGPGHKVEFSTNIVDSSELIKINWTERKEKKYGREKNSF